MNIDLLLVHPPHPKGMCGLTLPTLQQYLCSKGFSVVALERNKTHLDIEKAITEYKPRFVGISVPYSFYAVSALQLLRSLKSKYHIPIIVGGAHVTICPNDFKEADYICIGYGENYLLNLLSSKQPIPGLDMNDLPTIICNDKNLLCNGLYYNRYIGSRGCVFNCSFCSNNILSNGRIHHRDVDKVIDDLILLKSKGFNRIVFHDEVFTINKKRVKQLCQGILDNNLDIHWWCQTRANLLDDELASIMSKAGCDGISFGVESGDENVLLSCSKEVELASVILSIKHCHDYNMLAYGGFIIGFPSDTTQTVKNTTNFACSSNLDYAGFGLMMPFPGTKVREQAIVNNEKICPDLSKYYAGQILYIPSGLKNLNLKKLQLSCDGKFIRSSFHRLLLSGIYYFKQGNLKAIADFVRRICYKKIVI